MVDFVLYDAGVEILDIAADRMAVRIESGVVQAGPARHAAAQTGHRQAAFEGVFLFFGQRPQDRIDEDRLGHVRRLRIARIVAHAEDHELQVDADLRRGQAGAVGRMHGVEHVFDQGIEFRRVELENRLGHPQQPRIAHPENFPDRHVAPRSI